MFFRILEIFLFMVLLGFCGCVCGGSPKPRILDEKDKALAQELKIDEKVLSRLKQKPLYEFSETELDAYLRYLQKSQPELSRRIVLLAGKNVGQPHRPRVSGEYPFEIYDPNPLFRLDQSDSLGFVESTFAMALGYDWPAFMAFLQRIRYYNGEISVTARHRDLLTRWIPENSKWLLYDLTEDLAKEKIKTRIVRINPRQWFEEWNIAQDRKEEEKKIKYLAPDRMSDIEDILKKGDLVLFLYAKDESETRAEPGIIVHAEKDKILFIHSQPGGVREEILQDYLAKRSGVAGDGFPLMGMQFYRLYSDPVAKIRALDGPDAPKVSGPKGLLLSRYQHPGWVEPRAQLGEADLKAAKALKIDPDYLAVLKLRPLFEFDKKDIGVYLAWLQEVETDLPKRLVHLARKNIGQPYQIFLLGEFPFELYDDDPLFAIHKSDCVVFSEHMFSMALSRSWEQFIVFLQRLRYKDGEIGVLTRNHFTIAEWDQNNAWLLEDISQKLAGSDAKPMFERTSHKSFFKERYGIEVDMPEITLDTYYVPTEKVPDVAQRLQNGDFVNVIFGNGKDCYASHVGLITLASDGTVNFLHSTPPRVREESLLGYNKNIAEKNKEREEKKTPLFCGFKFFRLRENPMEELRKSDGPDAPVVRAPLGVLQGPGRRWTP